MKELENIWYEELIIDDEDDKEDDEIDEGEGEFMKLPESMSTPTCYPRFICYDI